MKLNRIAAAVASLSLIASGNALATADQWEHSIGTGLFGLNLEGDQGMAVNGRSVELKDFELDSSDVRDYTDSAFGFGGASKKGDWKIAYKFATLKLEGDESTVFAGGPLAGRTAKAEASFDATNAEIAGIYTFARNNLGHWGALGGLHYYEQEVDIKASVGGLSDRVKREVDWTDFLVGLTHELPIGTNMVWHNKLTAGIGDGNSYNFSTGLGWRFAKAWSADFYYDYKKYDYEDGNKGDADWYLYNVKEYGVGASIAYHF